MTTPVIVIATFTPEDGKREALLDALRTTVPAIHEEPGCELYSVHEALDGTVVQIEKWTSRELLDQHSAAAPVTALKEGIAPFLAKPQVLAILSPVPVGDLVKGAL